MNLGSRASNSIALRASYKEFNGNALKKKQAET
jgi:hypothetical protein